MNFGEGHIAHTVASAATDVFSAPLYYYYSYRYL